MNTLSKVLTLSSVITPQYRDEYSRHTAQTPFQLTPFVGCEHARL
jgi:hypothetical protein